MVRMMRLWAPTLALALALSGQGAAHAQQTLTAEAMWRLARVGAPALSPDGTQAAVSITRIDPADESRSSDLWLYAVDGARPPRQLTQDRTSESDAVWSPDGRMIAFTARREGDAAPQVYVIAATGGAPVRVTSVATGAARPHWVGGSRRIAFVSRVWSDLDDWTAQAERLAERAQSRVTAMAWDRAPISAWDTLLDDRAWHIFVADLDGGAPAPVTRSSGYSVAFNELGGAPFDVSPDGREFAFVANVDPTGVEENNDIILIATNGSDARNITAHNPALDEEPVYSPDGRMLAFASARIPRYYADRTRLVLYDRMRRRTRTLTESFDRSIPAVVWSGDSRTLFGAVDDAGTRRVYAFEAAGRAPPRALTGEHDITGLAAARDALVGQRQSFSAPPELVRIDPRTGAVAALSHVNDATLANTALGRVESVTYAGADGAPIQMWITYPPGFDPAKRWPLLLLLHGGPHVGVTDGWSWRWNAQVFAAWGYVVAWHNFHGSSGFGEAFADSINPNRADLPYADTIAAADWFRAKPWIDADRMVAAGGSYGGYLASVLLGRPHPFKALVAHAPVYNAYTQIAADYGAERNRFFEYWERPEDFQRNSPHMAAAHFATPTLIIHGAQDRRVPVNQSIELFNTLQVRRVPSRLVYFPNENHWVLNAQNSIRWYGEVQAWVARYAPPGPR